MSFLSFIKRMLLFRWLFGSNNSRRCDCHDDSLDRYDCSENSYDRDGGCVDSFDRPRYDGGLHTGYHRHRIPDMEAYYDDPADYDPTDFDEADDLDFFGLPDNPHRDSFGLYDSDFLDTDFMDTNFMDTDFSGPFDSFDDY